ncbi:hypothetical protein A3739_03770 [Oleiphilus sp. HI0067]|nr:hypothetical protein A3739_03770 [Oleiphilus sp. HI0067]
MIHDYYSLTELSDRWSKLFKTEVTLRDILRLGATGKLQIHLLTLGLGRHYKLDNFGLRKRWCNPKEHTDDKQFLSIEKFEQLSKETVEKIEATVIDGELLEFRELSVEVEDWVRETVYYDIPEDSILILTNYIRDVRFSTSDLYVVSDEVERYERLILGGSSGEKSSKISEQTLYLIIALLKKELLLEKGWKQNALIMDLVEQKDDLKGISKSTLESVFAEANRKLTNR